MKFTHIADCHLGGWREPKLRQLNLEAFKQAIEISKLEKVDFVLIAGDLFNTSLPPIDTLKAVVQQLKLLQEHGIWVFAIAGSHDFSPSGKTMLDVLESAGLLVNVAKGSSENDKLKLEYTSHKSGAVLGGIPGRRNMLDSSYYKNLEPANVPDKGFKIFMFHTAISEFKPKQYEQMESMALSFLPKGFDYYAGGHVHEPLITKAKGYPCIVMPGPLFPNNFGELEKLESGTFVLFEDGKVELKHIKSKPVVKFNVECEGKTPEKINSELNKLLSQDIRGALVLIRLEGKLSAGKLSEIDFPATFKKGYEQGAYFIMKNSSKVHSPEFEGMKVDSSNTDEVESKLIQEHESGLEVFKKEKGMVKELINALSSERGEGETRGAYDDRLLDEFLERVTKSI